MPLLLPLCLEKYGLQVKRTMTCKDKETLNVWCGTENTVPTEPRCFSKP